MIAERRLGCHPASDFGFTFRIPAGHQSLQTAERARHVAFARRETWSIVHRCGLSVVVQEVEPGVVHYLRSDLGSPKQEISYRVSDLIFPDFRFLGNLTLRWRAS